MVNIICEELHHENLPSILVEVEDCSNSMNYKETDIEEVEQFPFIEFYTEQIKQLPLIRSLISGQNTWDLTGIEGVILHQFSTLRYDYT